MRHDGALGVAQEKVVPLLPEHDSESGTLVAHYFLVDEAHVLQDVLDVQAAALVHVVLDHVLVLAVQLHGQVVVRGGAGGLCGLSLGPRRRLAVESSLVDAGVLSEAGDPAAS